MSKLKIAIGFPSPERFDHRFSKDLLDIIFHNWIDYDLYPLNPVSSRIVLNRNTIVKDAQRVKADYLLWIDSDTRFPHNGLKRLLAHNKDVVCATTSRRMGEHRGPAAYPMDVKAVQPFQKLVDMRFVGFPFMLTKMSVYDKLEKPYFAEPPRRMANIFEAKEYIGAEELFNDVVPEDEYFCHNLRAAGFDIWCDMELTMEIGHIGTTVYYVKSPLPEGVKEGNITFEEVLTEPVTEEKIHRVLGGVGE